MSHCTQCGSKLADGSKFCSECGARVAAVDAESPKTLERATGTEVSLTALIPPQPARKASLRWNENAGVLEFMDQSSTTIERIDMSQVQLKDAFPVRQLDVGLTWRPAAATSDRSILIGFKDQAAANEFIASVRRAASLAATEIRRDPAQPVAQYDYSAARSWGRFLTGAGIVGAIYFFFFFSTAVEVPSTTILGTTVGGGYVNNLGLMHEQQMGAFASIGAIVIGVLLFMLDAMRPRQPKT